MASTPSKAVWQFNPNNIEVKRGEPVVFNNPRGNDHPHTVTNLRRTTPPTTVAAAFVGGDIFDSGTLIRVSRSP